MWSHAMPSTENSQLAFAEGLSNLDHKYSKMLLIGGLTFSVDDLRRQIARNYESIVTSGMIGNYGIHKLIA